MTNVFKKISFSLFGIFAFLIAGVFFAGCGVDYDKISLKANVSSVELEVGQSVDLVFTIDGYQEGFSNEIWLDVRNSGQTQILEYDKEEFKYINENEILVTIKGKAGGSGTIVATTLEKGKSCEVSVFVKQNSNTMDFDNRVLYVSNSTEFIPSADAFTFDPNTTNKGLTYYYIEQVQTFDYSKTQLASISAGKAVFDDGKGISYECNVTEIDEVVLERDGQINQLVMKNNTVEVKRLAEEAVDETFEILAIYNYSIENPDQYNSKILYDIAPVNVLPDIEVRITGGYYKNNSVVNDGFGYVDFEDEYTQKNEGPILIVPNNKNMRRYLLRVEMLGSIDDAKIEIEKLQDNNFIDIDFVEYEEELGKESDAGVVYYLKLSHNSQYQATTNFTLNVFYDIAQGISDESVNSYSEFSSEIKIAPNAITVNGSTEPDELLLYNYYKYPEFGWHELYVDVVSGFDSSANFDGVYLEFNETFLDVMYNGVTVNSGAGYLYTDLSEPFYVRGKYGTIPNENLVLKVCARSQFLEGGNKLTPVEVACRVIAGATELVVDEKYVGVDSAFYVDLDGGTKTFDGQLYANQQFQSITYKLLEGVDVVDINISKDVPFVKKEGFDERYYLNLTVSPKILGMGRYRIFLDNGINVDVNFYSRTTLDETKTTIKLADSGNEAVTAFELSRQGGAGYDNVVDIDVLNASDKNSVYFGSQAFIEIQGNLTATAQVVVGDGEDYVSALAVADKTIRFTTLGNGNAVAMLTLKGISIDDFRSNVKTVSYTINICSYSLVNEYYLKNGPDFAIDNTVYFGNNVQKTEKQISFTPYVNKVESSNFYANQFVVSSAKAIFEDAEEDIDAGPNQYNYYVDSSQIEMVQKRKDGVDGNGFYDKKYIYFFVQDENGAMVTSITANVTKRPMVGVGQTREVRLVFGNGIMFTPEDFTFETVDDDDKTIFYEVEFGDVEYSIGSAVATFNMSTFTFEYLYNATYNGGISLQSSLRQPNQTKKYNVKINTLEYQSVRGISLATNLTGLDFSNDRLVYELGVYTYPANTTNKNVRVEFVRTNNNPYSDMLQWQIDATQKESGLFTIKLSCEAFYDKYKAQIVNINDFLTGKIYIYPADWGDSYTTINSQFVPIELDVQYRNGSKANPYLLENAEDVLNINASAITLQSHYEIGTVIDMSTVKGATPIGILGNNIVGFSGSIVGSNSQAAISNIFISNEDFAKTVGGTSYYGLFARINKSAELQNIQFSGAFNLEGIENSKISLATCENQGILINVGAKVQRGKIVANGNHLIVFGGVVAENKGIVMQDFSKFDGTEKAYKRYELSQIEKGGVDGKPDYYVTEVVGFVETAVEVDEFGYVLSGGSRVLREESEVLHRDFSGQSSKNLAYYNDFVEFETTGATVVAGGVVGTSNGLVQRLAVRDGYKIYGYGEYTAYTLLKFSKNASGYVAMGGAVGAVVADGVAFNGKNLISGEVSGVYFDNRVENLLVGGEISSERNAIANDFVGGVAGIVDTCDKEKIYITNNTTRAFVRANDYVGSLVGGEIYNSYSNLAEYGKKNLTQAIDDGVKAEFFASMMIRYSYNDATAPKLDDESTADYDESISVAVGNGFGGGRDYTSAGFEFTFESYVKRNQVGAVGNNANVETSNVSSFNGDYVLIEFDGNYKIRAILDFEDKEIDLDLEETGYEMTCDDAGASELNVYFMKYFYVNQDLSGNFDETDNVVTNLNIHNPNSNFYPFKLGNNSVNIIATSSNIMAIDVDGNIELKGTGLATIQLTSILNAQVTRVIYVYITHYFEKDVESSIFYTSGGANGNNVVSGAGVTIYGSSTTAINLVPNYYLLSGHTYISERDDFSISQDGVLTYRGVAYELKTNANLTVDYSPSVGSFSEIQVNKQTVVFFKKDGSDPSEDEVDEYSLIPILKTEVLVGGETYVFYYELDGAQVDLKVNYKETATAINTQYKFHSIQTSNFFNEKVFVVSQNTEEMLFYQIVKRTGTREEVVQSKLPLSLLQMFEGEIDLAKQWEKWEAFVNADVTNKDLFKIHVDRTEANQFNVKFEVNKLSDAYKKRFEKNIYGEYIVRLFANELEEGVSTSFRVELNEAEISYLSVNNYSNIKDAQEAVQIDSKLVPTQKGLLEIIVDPSDAVFEKMEISNNALNYLNGATEASITFVYKKISATPEYVEAPNFGVYKDGKLQFSYQDMVDYFAKMNKEFEDKGENAEVMYDGKVYVSYFMPSKNVDDAVSVGFDVKAEYGGGKTINSSIFLKTKLKNYAKLSFANKPEHDGVYYVARGLSYNMNMNSFGFSADQISVEVVADDASVATVTKTENGYVLNVASKIFNYNGDKGYKVNLKTTASKTVDNVTISTEDILEIYIMEYVVNYVYVEGVNEDIVKGMENGVISTSIGNPYKLEFAIRDFLEYDKNDEVVNAEVETFVRTMTENLSWKVYYSGKETLLEQGKIIKDDYYYINSFTVTPLKLYNASSDIYHFSAGAYYAMENGVYIYRDSALNANRIYTEFSFDVHNQSTQDSPLPIETYNDLINMKDGEYYILLNDIALPSEEMVLGNSGVKQFLPLDKNIKGLDGNGYAISFAGTYNFSGYSQVGLFGTVRDGVLLKNMTIVLANDTIFKMDTPSFRIGLLASSSQGEITNGQVSSVTVGNRKTTLSILSSVTTTDAYVGGLLGENSGNLTNSRSMVSIMSYVNMAGLVGVNSGKIASSCYKEGYLNNQTNTTNEYTAGLVVNNTGKIYTSYVSGTASASSMYYMGSSDYVKSNNNVSGFVYSNAGEISDCYSNIKINQSGKFASGFVYDNSGKINKCFSTSVLENNKTSNYGFARMNREDGKIDNCFYLSDADVSVNVNISDINDDNGRVNIAKLDVDGFGKDNLKTNFSEFAYVEGRGVNSVWFFNQGGDASMFGAEKAFNKNRLELVAPNIDAYSRRELYSVENVVDEETGATYVKYIYIYSNEEFALGSFYNPITISNAEEMENFILQENNLAGYNYASYRLIKDIDYSAYLYNSKLFKTKFVGYLEGNFMAISGINLLSSDKMSFAGLFAEVGNSGIFDANGTLLNFDFSPSIVSFSNTTVVGSLAGKVDNANVVNVNLNQSADVVVVGNNVVGGAIGLAVGNYTIQNVYSNYNAKARSKYDAYVTRDEQDDKGSTFSESSSFTEYSIAGSLVGALAGNGRLFNASLDGNSPVSVLGQRAGLLVGYVGSGVLVEKVAVKMNNDMRVNCYNGYGGLVFGEARGWIKDVQVVGMGSDFVNFKKMPLIPTAVGGLAGKVGGGKIEDVQISQSIMTASASEDFGVLYVGGVAGKVTGAITLNNVLVENVSLGGYQYVGGVFGAVHDGVGAVVGENVSAINCSFRVDGRKQSEVAVGGFVGLVGEQSSVRLTNSVSKDVISWIDKVDDDNTTGFDLGGVLDALQHFIDPSKIAGTPKSESEYLDILSTFNGQGEDKKIQQLLIDAGILKQELNIYDGENNPTAETCASAKAIIERDVLPKLSQQEYKDKLVREIYNYYNVFEFEVRSTIYVFGAGIEYYLGSVVGKCKQTLSLAQCYTSVTGSCEIYDMSLQTGTKTSRVGVNDAGILEQVGEDISCKESNSSSGSYSQVNVSCITPKGYEGATFSYGMDLNYVGRLRLPLA